MRVVALSKVLALLLVGLLLVAFSPLTDGDTGWKDTVGDIVWSGMFLVFGGLISLAVVAVVNVLRTRA